MNNNHMITSVEELRAVLPTGFASGDEKVLTHLDEHCRHFISLSPFLTIASRNAAGQMDVSPKGDPAGFVRVLDDHTLAIPERPGNRRCDTFTNVLEVPEVALIFLVPGEDLTLRVMGRASITVDPDLLALMAIRDRAPLAALQISVTETFLHCGKAPKRAGLWNPDTFVDGAAVPAMGAMLHDQIAAKVGTPDFGITKSDMVDSIETDYRDNVY